MVDRVPDPGTLAVPEGDEVQVWWARLTPGALGDDTRARLAADLDAGTLARARRYVRPEDQDRALAAHSLLRRVLAAVAGGRPAGFVLGTRCGHCGSPEHGKPYLRSPEPLVEVNLSHSGPVVCVALGGPGAGLGIDVEARRGVDWPALRRSVFADSEWAVTEAAADPERGRTDAWARKEASVKSCGWGLSMSLSKVVVTSDLDDRSDGWADGWTAALTDGLGTAHGRDLALGADVAAAVAVHRRPDDLRPMVSPLVRFVAQL